MTSKDWAAWIEVKKPFPYGWFFKYYEMHAESGMQYDRQNRLDGLFDWICWKLSKKYMA